MHDWLQPVVLVGGKSRRFGRDKLCEPLHAGEKSQLLVDASITALREVFGARVAVVGECSSLVAARADMVIAEKHSGAGPIGGVLSALEVSGQGVFVLAGDLPLINAGVVRSILDAAERTPQAWAILARSDRVEPCIGVYRSESAPGLAARLAAGDYALAGSVPIEKTELVDVPARAVINVNTPEALQRVTTEGGSIKNA